MNKVLNRLLFITLISSFAFTNSSCFFNNFFRRVEPFKYKALAQRGSGALALCNHFLEDNLTFTDDISVLEEAFKGTGQDDDYQFIVYDTIRGLELSKMNGGHYVYVGTISRGNYQLVPLKKDVNPNQSLKILANNEHGALGSTLDAFYKNNPKYDITYTTKNDREYYDYFYSKDYLELDYDYAFISEPYATRLMTLKDSPLYDKDYDYYTDKGHSDVNSVPIYCRDVKTLYETYNDSKFNDRGIPQNGIFINKDYFASHKDTMTQVLELIDIQMYNKFVIDAQYCRLDFVDLSEEYNDPNEDPNSEQTQIAFKYQFDTTGISWNEVARLQTWHSILGESAPFEKFPNRLRYAKSLQKYYTEDYFKEYYRFIGKEYPGDELFMKIKLN